MPDTTNTLGHRDLRRFTCEPHYGASACRVKRNACESQKVAARGLVEEVAALVDHSLRPWEPVEQPGFAIIRPDRTRGIRLSYAVGVASSLQFGSNLAQGSRA